MVEKEARPAVTADERARVRPAGRQKVQEAFEKVRQRDAELLRRLAK